MGRFGRSQPQRQRTTTLPRRHRSRHHHDRLAARPQRKIIGRQPKNRSLRVRDSSTDFGGLSSRSPNRLETTPPRQRIPRTWVTLRLRSGDHQVLGRIPHRPFKRDGSTHRLKYRRNNSRCRIHSPRLNPVQRRLFRVDDFTFGHDQTNRRLVPNRIRTGVGPRPARQRPTGFGCRSRSRLLRNGTTRRRRPNRSVTGSQLLHRHRRPTSDLSRPRQCRSRTNA